MAESDAWVGVGFSRDREMGQDDIYYCQKRGEQIGVISAYSVGMSRPIELDASRLDNGIAPDSLRTYANQNQFVCSFRRPISVTKNELGKLKSQIRVLKVCFSLRSIRRRMAHFTINWPCHKQRYLLSRTFSLWPRYQL